MIQMDTDLLLDLTPTQKVALKLLSSFTKAYSEIEAAVRYISKQIGISMRQGYRIMSQLTRMGLLQKRSRPGRTSVYRVVDWVLSLPHKILRKVWDSPAENVRGMSGVCQGSASKGDMYKLNLPKKEDSNESKIVENDHDSSKEVKKEKDSEKMTVLTEPIACDKETNESGCGYKPPENIPRSDNLCSVTYKIKLFRKHLGKDIPYYEFDYNALKLINSLSERDVARAAESFTVAVRNEWEAKKEVVRPLGLLTRVIRNLDNPNHQPHMKRAQNANKEEISQPQSLVSFVLSKTFSFFNGWGFKMIGQRIFAHDGNGAEKEIHTLHLAEQFYYLAVSKGNAY